MRHGHRLGDVVAHGAAQAASAHNSFDRFAGWIERNAGDAAFFRVGIAARKMAGQVMPGRVVGDEEHVVLLPAHGGQGMYGERVHKAVLAAGDQVA